EELILLDVVADIDRLVLEIPRDLGIEIGVLKPFERNRLARPADDDPLLRVDHLDGNRLIGSVGFVFGAARVFGKAMSHGATMLTVPPPDGDSDADGDEPPQEQLERPS